jgi:hypothetical protein
MVSKDRAIRRSKKYICISMAYNDGRLSDGAAATYLFLPGGKICRLQRAKRTGVIASRECRLY